jgi:hypothetical protein
MAMSNGGFRPFPVALAVCCITSAPAMAGECWEELARTHLGEVGGFRLADARKSAAGVVVRLDGPDGARLGVVFCRTAEGFRTFQTLRNATGGPSSNDAVMREMEGRFAPLGSEARACLDISETCGQETAYAAISAMIDPPRPDSGFSPAMDGETGPSPFLLAGLTALALAIGAMALFLCRPRRAGDDE